MRKLAYTQQACTQSPCTQWVCAQLTHRRQPTSVRGVASGITSMMPIIPITALITTTDLMIIGLTRMRRRCHSSSASGSGRGGNRGLLESDPASLKPSAEFFEHIEEPRLIAIIGDAIDHHELHDHVDGHGRSSSGSAGECNRTDSFIIAAGAFTARSHRYR
jgi:hypothetical protein